MPVLLFSLHIIERLTCLCCWVSFHSIERLICLCCPSPGESSQVVTSIGEPHRQLAVAPIASKTGDGLFHKELLAATLNSATIFGNSHLATIVDRQRGRELASAHIEIANMPVFLLFLLTSSMYMHLHNRQLKTRLAKQQFCSDVAPARMPIHTSQRLRRKRPAHNMVCRILAQAVLLRAPRPH